jgi:hypothetical protein
MPFTSQQLLEISAMVSAVNAGLNVIAAARDQIEGLADGMHDGFASNMELVAVLRAAQIRARNAAQGIVDLLA